MKGKKKVVLALSTASLLGLSLFAGGLGQHTFAASDSGGDSNSGSSTNSMNTATNVLGAPAADQQTISFSSNYPVVDQLLTLKAAGLSANQTYKLVWETFKGGFAVDGNTFIGESYTPDVETLRSVTADGSGLVKTTFKIPEGYGDIHQVGLVDSGGIVVAQGNVTVKPSVSIKSSTIAEGGFFELQMKGIGYGAYSSVYQVLYDNRLTGDVTAVSTNGTATFKVRAEGLGSHRIDIQPSSIGLPYLNEQQSPYSWKPGFDFPVNVTKGAPKDVLDSIPAPSVATGTNLAASPGHGITGSTFTLSGKSLQANANFTIEWSTTVGNHVTQSGYHGAAINLGKVSTDAKGNFTKKLTVPVDVGGPAHVIQVIDADGNIAGTTSYQIYPSFISAPTTVKEGELFTVHLQGGGPDTYDNVYSALYDNGVIGYACGFNSKGDMQFQIRAIGAPGVHYVDLYPAIQQGNEKVPNIYLLPLLTYQNDHPGQQQPAFHLVFTIQK